jgi:hypothetical protein
LVTHSYADMVRARMMMITAGHEDCDDIDRLKTDPAFKIVCNRAPESGVRLMSPPTMSLLENAADARALYRIGMGLIDLFCRGYRAPPFRSCSTSTIPTTSCMAASSWRCSTAETRKFFGYALHFAQHGDQHPAAKALKGFGGWCPRSGRERRGRHISSRVYGQIRGGGFHAALLPEEQERHRSPKEDMDVIRARLKVAETLAKEMTHGKPHR